MIVPFAYAKRNNTRQELLGGETGLPDGSNSFNQYTFVVLTAGFLAAVDSAGTSTCGLVLDASKASTLVDPPYAMFGDRHYPQSPAEGQRFAVSVTDAAGHVGEANGAPQLSAVTLGASYGIIKLANGNHALNVANTTNLFFKVVKIPTKFNSVIQNSTTYNPVVIVEIVGSAIQTV